MNLNLRRPRLTPRRAVIAGLLLPLALVAPYAIASWLSQGTGVGAAAATSINRVAAAPTVTANGAQATISWQAATMANGGAVDGYRVLRHVGATVTTPCTTSSPTALTCDDPNPSTSSATYGVVAYKSGWTGPESPLSSSFVSDSTAPTTTITRSPAGTDATWNRVDVLVTLNASDGAGSGVKEIRYTVNGGAETVVPAASTQLTVTREDANALVFWAVDNAGNAETPRNTATVRVDKTNPVTAATLSSSGAPSGGYYRSDVTVTLTASDTSPNAGAAPSGVTKVEYQLNGTGGTWQTYNSASKPVVSAEGATTVHFRATDLAGNTETAKQTTVQIDRTAPAVNSSLSPAPNTDGWNNSNVTVTLSANDGASGVASTEYQLNGTGGAWLTYNATTKPVVSTEGTTTLYFRATDNVGNVSTPGMQVVKLDKTAPTGPTATVSLANPNGANGWYTTVPTVTLSGGTDSGSGLLRTEYQLNGTSGPWLPYSSAVVIPDQAITTVHYRTVDTAGNTSAIGNTGALKVDTVAPTVTPKPADSTAFAKNEWKNDSSKACQPVSNGNGSAKLCVTADGGVTGAPADVTSAVTYKLARLGAANGNTTHCWNGSSFAAATTCTAQPMTYASGMWASGNIGGTEIGPTNNVTSYYRWTVSGIKDQAGNVTPETSYIFSVVG